MLSITVRLSQQIVIDPFAIWYFLHKFVSTSNIANTPVPSHLYELFISSKAGTIEEPSITVSYAELVYRHAAAQQFSTST